MHATKNSFGNVALVSFVELCLLVDILIIKSIINFYGLRLSLHNLIHTSLSFTFMFSSLHSRFVHYYPLCGLPLFRVPSTGGFSSFEPPMFTFNIESTDEVSPIISLSFLWLFDHTSMKTRKIIIKAYMCGQPF